MSAARALALVLLLWAAGLGAAGQFAKIAVPLEALAAALGAGTGALGWSLTLVSLMGVLLGGVAGGLVARRGARRVLLAALGLGAALSLAQAALPPLPLLLASRVLEGLSHLAIVVAAPALMATLAPPRWGPAALTLWSTFFGVGFALTGWLGPPLVAAAGPGALFLAHAGWMAALALLLAALLPRDAVPAPPPPGQSGAGPLAAWRSAATAAPAAGWLFYTLAFLSLLTVLPAAGHAGIAPLLPLASIAASLGPGLWLMRRRPAARVATAGFTLAAACAAGLAMAPGAVALPLAVFAALGLVQGASFAAVPQLNPGAEDRALAYGAIAQTGNLGNLVGTPLLLALLGGLGPVAPGLFGLACFASGAAALALLARHPAPVAVSPARGR